MIILSSAIILNVNTSVNDAKMVNFARELESITEKVNLYYLDHYEFPVIDGTSKISIEQLMSLANLQSNYREILLEEINEKKENLDEVTFYQIDLSKLGVKRAELGTKAYGENDIYVVSSNMNIYYLKGYEVNGIIYFSLSQKIRKYISIDKDDVVYGNQTVSGISVEKAYKTWTNKMGITLKATVNTGETLYFKLPNSSEKKITTNTGLNIFMFNTLEDIKNGVVNISVENLTVGEINAFNLLTGNDKYIEIIKKNGVSVVGVEKIELYNYDLISPVYKNGTLNITRVENNKEIEFQVTDSMSGVSEVKYDYLTIGRADGEVDIYYNSTENIDSNYLIYKGKRATLNGETAKITVPDNIKSIKILVKDDASNWICFDLSI